MIWFDTTKSGRSGHHSGLLRMNRRLLAELGASATAVAGTAWSRQAQTHDWFLTAEVFSPDERPGWAELMANRPCRMAAVFNDAIPLKFPTITWPQSVRRFPSYMKMLAEYDWIWAISAASRRDLLGYWDWLGVANPPRVEVLPLGADFDGQPRRAPAATLPGPCLLCVGIIEPRKNQVFLLDVCERLWAAGVECELHVVGRVNPHFGKPVVQRMRRLARRWQGMHFHAALDDAGLSALFDKARAVVFPTRAEGCGLPVLEALWRGRPCVCSDLPVLRENADGGGCMAVPLTVPAWEEALRRILTDPAHYASLVAEGAARELPTWSQTAQVLRNGFAD